MTIFRLLLLQLARLRHLFAAKMSSKQVARTNMVLESLISRVYRSITCQKIDELMEDISY